MKNANSDEENVLKKIIKDRTLINYLIIIVIGIILSIPLLKGYIIGHDSDPHISRVISTIIGLRSHQFLPVIAPNYVNGLGYSWNLFYPPLTNYLTIICKLVCDTYTQALNLLTGLTIIASGIFMYHFVEKLTKSKNIGLLASILYMTVPYRISDIYIRYALGEVVGFVFIPLIFNGLYSIFYEENGKRNYLLTIGAVGLLLTHNISTLLIVVVCAIFVICHIDKLKNWRIIRDLAINAIFIIAMVGCFYGQFLENKNATEYAVFNEFASKDKVIEYAVDLWEIVIGNIYFSDDIQIEQRISVPIGVILCASLILTPFVYKKISKEKRRMYIISVVLSVFCIFASTKYFPWKYFAESFKFVQFPYRLLIITTFFLSIIAAVNIGKIVKELTYKKILVITLICLAYVTPLLISAKPDNTYDENRYYEIETIYPGHYSIFCSTYEYLPSKAYNNILYLFQRPRMPLHLTDNGEIADVQLDAFNNYTFKVNNPSEDIFEIEMPIVYYLGYTVTLEGEEIGYEESDNGLMKINIPKGKSGTVAVNYTGTEFSRACLIITIIGVLLFAIYMVISEIVIFKKRKIENSNLECK